MKTRKELAKSAFRKTAYYDGLIANWFMQNDELLETTHSSIPLKELANSGTGKTSSKSRYILIWEKCNLKISGKDLSYNNIYDLEIAIELAEQFRMHSCVILKHGNPCGVSLGTTQTKAYKKALKCDPISAFGGIVAFNKSLTKETAKEISKLFTEVVVAPDFDKESLEFLTKKKNLILVKYQSSKEKNLISIKSTRNFLLVQEKDLSVVSKENIVLKTKKKLVKNNLRIWFLVLL